MDKFRQKLFSLDPASDEFMYDLDDLVETIPPENGEECIPAIFEYFEAHPLEDFGAPGTLVHFVEDYYPKYKTILIESVKRCPSKNTILMINRILNSKLSEDERGEYISCLVSVVNNGKVQTELKDNAKRFIEYQESANK